MINDRQVPIKRESGNVDALLQYGRSRPQRASLLSSSVDSARSALDKAHLVGADINLLSARRTERTDSSVVSLARSAPAYSPCVSETPPIRKSALHLPGLENTYYVDRLRRGISMMFREMERLDRSESVIGVDPGEVASGVAEAGLGGCGMFRD